MTEKKEEKKTAKKSGESLGVAGFILGIISIVVGILIAPIFGIIASITGFTLSMIQQKKKPTKKGKLGIILNGIGFVVSIIWWIVLIKVLLPLAIKKACELNPELSFCESFPV